MRLARQAHEVGLARLDIDHVEKRKIGQHCRNDGVLHHLAIGNADIFGDQEGGGAHDRRHDLAVDRGRNLDGARLDGRIAHPLHQRDGEGPRGHHIGHRRARDQPCRR